MSRPTALYRLFGEADELLYVGVSVHPCARLMGHRDKDWFKEIVRATLEHFDTEQAGYAAEATAIEEERPKYNRNRGTGYPPVRNSANSEATHYYVHGGLTCDNCGAYTSHVPKGVPVKDFKCESCEVGAMLPRRSPVAA